jgi:preprotein translocase subunit SecB
MAEEQQTNAAGAADMSQAQFALQRMYCKDVSFEAPNTPEVFQLDGQMEMKMNLAQRVQELGENLYEVVLTVTITGTVEDKTAYLCEVHQAGIFHIAGMPDEQRNAMLNIHCPNSLYPYARAMIGQLVATAGFPPVMLQPISFEQVYAQRLQQQQQQAASGGNGNGAGAEA